jgi:hypothetical protein
MFSSATLVVATCRLASVVVIAGFAIMATMVTMVTILTVVTMVAYNESGSDIGSVYTVPAAVCALQ